MRSPLSIFRGLACAAVLVAVVVLPSSEATAAAVKCGGARATIVGSDGDDVLQGTPGDDVIDAGAGDDVVRGRGGDDLVCGDDGNDRVFGGHGKDGLLGDAGADLLLGGRGDDFYLAGEGDDRVSGGDGRDYLVDQLGDDVFNAGPGDDDYRPSNLPATDLADHDQIRMGDGNDHVESVSSRGVTISAGAGDDTVSVVAASPAPVSVTGGEGEDSVRPFFWSSTSVLTLDQSSDRLELDGMIGRFSGWEYIELYGHDDVDYTGQEGSEVLELYNADGALTASMLGGDDEVYGPYLESGPHIVDLGSGDDIVDGGGGDDLLRGGPGADTLRGSSGDDLLDGGPGRERLLDGGDGTDTAQDPDDDPATTDCLSIEIGFCAVPPG